MYALFALAKGSRKKSGPFWPKAAKPETRFRLQAGLHNTKTVISGYRSVFAAPAGDQRFWERNWLRRRWHVFCCVFFFRGGVLCKRLASGLATDAGVALPLCGGPIGGKPSRGGDVRSSLRLSPPPRSHCAPVRSGVALPCDMNVVVALPWEM